MDADPGSLSDAIDSLSIERHAEPVAPDNLDQIAAATTEDIKIASMRAPSKRLLNLQSQALHPATHIRHADRQPDADVARNRDHETPNAFTIAAASIGGVVGAIRSRTLPASSFGVNGQTSSGARLCRRRWPRVRRCRSLRIGMTLTPIKRFGGVSSMELRLLASSPFRSLDPVAREVAVDPVRTDAAVRRDYAEIDIGRSHRVRVGPGFDRDTLERVFDIMSSR